MAKKMKELHFNTPNRPGVLAVVSDALQSARVNIVDICAWGEGTKAHFAVVTNNNAAARRVLKKLRLRVSEKDVLALNLRNKIGSLARISKKLAKARINISCLGATTAGKRATVLIHTSNDRKAMRLV